MTVAQASMISAEDAARHAREVVERSGTSFGAGMKILTKPRREGMFAVYAYCREIDDIADEGGAAEEKIRGLTEWRNELTRLYDGRPTRMTSRALLPVIRRFELPKSEFILLIEGMEMDAKGPVVAPSMDELFGYTRRVAGAVGALSMRVFGVWEGQKSEDFAVALADALQLTNILRDVGEDAEIGRLYLPQELLEKHGVVTRDPKEVVAHPNIGRVAEDLGAIAKARFETVREMLPGFDWRKLRPALLMMGAYETYLKRLEARGWDNIGPPMKLKKREKVLIAIRWALWPPIKRKP